MNTIKDFELIQGDCLEIMPRLSAGLIDMVLADIPYGTTNNKWDSVIPLEPMWKQLKRLTGDHTPILLFSQMPFGATLIASNKKWFRSEWIWKKTMPLGFLNSHKMPMRAHENILVFYKHLPTYNPQMRPGEPYKKTESHSRTSNYDFCNGTISHNPTGDRYPVDVVEFSNDIRPSMHPTQKPVPLLEYLIKTYTNPGDRVLDFTMGSGSTGVACAQTGRKFTGIELDPDYFKTAQTRIYEALEVLSHE